MTTTTRPSVSSFPDASTSFNRHAASIALITLAMVAMFWRVFFLGETIVDVATLNNQLPWGYHAGETSDYPYNRRDLTDTYITRDYFVVDAYRDGELPLWNPYTMAGHPIYADGVTRTLSPFLLVYTFLDVPLGYTIARITELLLAAIFLYIFLAGIGVGPGGALMGSLVFGFSAGSMLHLSGLGWWGGLMWLPIILLFVDRAASRKSYSHALWAGVFFAVQFFCGWMQNQVYYAGAIILYYHFLFLTPAGGGERLLSRSTLSRMVPAVKMMAVTLAAGFALAATQWMPVMELLRYSNRRIVPTEIGYIYLPPWYLATLVFPNLFGSTDDTQMLRLFTALNVSHDHVLYLGIAALLPLLFCVKMVAGRSRFRAARAERAQDRDGLQSRALFFVILLVVSLLIMTAAPLYVHITRFLPVVQTIRVIVRAGVLFLFAASALSAIGMHQLLKADGAQLKAFSAQAARFFYAALIFVTASVAGAYLLRLAGVLGDPGKERVVGSGALEFARSAITAFAVQFLPPRPAILIPLVFMVAVILTFRMFAWARISGKAFAASLALLLATDLFWYGTHFNPTYDRAKVFPKTEITERLKSLPPGRVLVTPSDFDTNRRAGDDRGREKIIAPPNTLLRYRISTVTGKDQLFPKWYREFCSLIEPQPNLSHVVFDEHGSRYFDLLNVRYVLTHASRPPLPEYELIEKAEGVAIYENKAALPRAWLVSHSVDAEGLNGLLSQEATGSFDPRRTVVLEGQGGASTPGDSAGGVAGIARIIEDKRNSVLIETESDKECFLVLSDNFYSGWQAAIDGAPADVLRANHTMRAIRVGAGKHVVSFRFDPWALKGSLYLSAAAALVIAAFLAFLRLRGRALRQEI